MLKLEPMWDPLRKDPRFQALIDKHAQRPSSKAQLKSASRQENADTAMAEVNAPATA
jgi:hypothetical protein